MLNYSKDGITVAVIQDTRRKLSNGEYPIRVRVTYRRRRSYYSTGKSLTIEDWDKLFSARSARLVSARKDIENSFTLVQREVEILSSQGSFSLSLLDARLKMSGVYTLNDFLENKIEELQVSERFGTAQTYSALKHTLQIFGGKAIAFDAVTPEWLNRFESFMRVKMSNKQTTIAIRMRTLKAVFNEARRKMLIKESIYPFGKERYEIQEGDSRKLALNIDEIKMIANFEPNNDTLAKYRDYWLFLYLCNGINVADFVGLKYDNIVDGELYFIRQKTKRTTKSLQRVNVALTKPMLDIIDRRGNKDRSGYIFPILDGNETPYRIKQKTIFLTRAINKYMSLVADELGLPHISTSTARHSFATILKRAGVNIAYISESMGHANITTTAHYLAKFEKEERKKNALILTQF